MICTDTYRHTVRHGYPPEFITLTCERTDTDEQGRHRGRHHGWEDMPAGERSIRVPDPARPGWTMPGTETFGPWRRLWTWSEGGASGSSYRAEAPVPCRSCGTPTYQESPVPHEALLYTGAPDAYAVAGDPAPQECFHCRLWARRIQDHAAGWQQETPRRGARGPLIRTVRARTADGTPSDRLQAWVDGRTGAYGDRAVIVQWDDGDTRGPDSCLWDSGAIPWWLTDEFPPNATVTPARRPAR